MRFEQIIAIAARLALSTIYQWGEAANEVVRADRPIRRIVLAYEALVSMSSTKGLRPTTAAAATSSAR
jgi:hypothetical protein